MATAVEMRKVCFSKQGGSYRNWNKRYFVLKDDQLTYYKGENDAQPRGTIDLKTGRGVRSKAQCKTEWPNAAKAGLAFAVATESRTYYLYGNDKATVKEWMATIQDSISKVGKPTDNYKEDPEGKPESTVSKAVRGSVKVASQFTKLIVKESGIVDEETADTIGNVAEAVEKQADADRDASMTDRLKMAGGDAAGIGLEGTSNLVDNEIASGALSTAADVVKDQVEADEDMSLKQRLALGAGSTLEGTSGMIENDVASSAMEVAGGVVKDQAEADEDADLKQRLAIAVGSAADGVADLDAVEGNVVAQAVCKATSAAAEQVQEAMENGDEEEEAGDEDKKDD